MNSTVLVPEMALHWQVVYDNEGYQKLVCNGEDVTDEIGHVSKTDLEPIAEAHNACFGGLYADLKEIEYHCPCGARPESLNTHSHVGGCPVDRALRRLNAPSVEPKRPKSDSVSEFPKSDF